MRERERERERKRERERERGRESTGNSNREELALFVNIGVTLKNYRCATMSRTTVTVVFSLISTAFSSIY